MVPAMVELGHQQTEDRLKYELTEGMENRAHGRGTRTGKMFCRRRLTRKRFDNLRINTAVTGTIGARRLDKDKAGLSLHGNATEDGGDTQGAEVRTCGNPAFLAINTNDR